jgi:methylated-DNA-[protein]-cysteine S-methyltransferase
MKKISEFEKRVYAVVSKIKKGSLMTYKEVAKMAGSPNASRAVGTALSKNYNPKIPCHRVIRSDGRLGSYNRGGVSAKKKLLTGEGALSS